jgi:DNA-binding CsgD family transcriptional regulator
MTHESFALAQVRQHGTPFVLLVGHDGRIHRADRREGWRELVASTGRFSGNRLPERLAAVVRRHALHPPSNGAATVTVVGSEVVMCVVSFDDSDEVFACSLWALRREQAVDAARRRYTLTNRECELLALILRGEPSAEIARALSISLATVEWHTKRLLLKTDSQNRTQMAARVLGWLPDAS